MSDDQRNAIQQEVDNNLEFFLTELPNIPATQNGKVALLRHRAIVGYYDTIDDAIESGTRLYPDEVFSVQQVTTSAVNLGFYSYAVPVASAQ